MKVRFEMVKHDDRDVILLLPSIGLWHGKNRYNMKRVLIIAFCWLIFIVDVRFEWTEKIKMKFSISEETAKRLMEER